MSNPQPELWIVRQDAILPRVPLTLLQCISRERCTQGPFPEE